LQVRRVFWRSIADGVSSESAAVAAGVSRQLGQRWFAEAGGMSPIELCEPAGRYLSADEREIIGLQRAAGSGVREIARLINRHPSTVSRELRRNCLVRRPHRYRPRAAQDKAERRARRPKASKLAACPRLHEEVQRRLTEDYSPEQVAASLREEFPDDPSMRISHESIYRSLYVQGRGELRRELAKCLRTGRAMRKPQRRVERRELVKISV
jgi:IS30 family transposase